MSRSAAATGTERADGSIRSADAVYGLFSSLIRHTPRDLNLTALATLVTLDRTGPRRITDLARIEGITQPSVTALVTNLAQAGLVERRSHLTDKRVVLVALTATGSEYLRSRRRTSVDVFAQIIDKLPAEETAALAAAVLALVHLGQLDDEHRDPRPPTDERHEPEHG
jgi:DNA-binding MarR family transcriptional regulator